MDNSNQAPKAVKSWKIGSLILIAIIALSFGQAIKKHPNNFPTKMKETLSLTAPTTTPDEATTPPTASLLNQGGEGRVKLQLNGAIFNVEVAKTQIEQERGLSGRAELGATEGMIFIYPSTSSGQAATNIPNFWMKDMNFALDIIWIDENKKIVGIETNVTPETFPKTFSPKTPIKYVLEVPTNTAAKNNLKVGDLIHF